jgi:hypothetical protein
MTMLIHLAWISLALAFTCAAIIILDEIRHPQKMAIMDVVWPVTALYLSIVGLWWYFHSGRRMARHSSGADHAHHQQQNAGSAPTWPQSLLAASHCGAGCALADIGVEFAIFFAGLTIAGSAIWASFVWDFVGAWTLGIAFQYFSIKPMRNISAGAALLAAIKSDTLSVIAFQIGMYAWMVVVRVWLFPVRHPEPVSPIFWLMMQVAMALGLLTATPMNRWLVRVGWKEKMG